MTADAGLARVSNPPPFQGGARGGSRRSERFTPHPTSSLKGSRALKRALARHLVVRSAAALRALFAVVALGAISGVAQAESETLWELMPYRVQVLLALTPEAETCGDLLDELPVALTDRAYSVVGARWTFTSAGAPLALRQAMLYSFDSMQAEQALSAELPDACDKALLVRISFVDGVYGIDTRDFDVRTQLFSPPVKASVVHRAQLADAVFQTLVAAFAPLARVEGVDGDKITLRVRAAAVPAREPSIALPTEKTIFRPVIRTNDRTGKVKRLQPVEWTYLVGESLTDSQLSCRLVTAFRSPLSARRRGRTEQLALALHPADRETTLELRTADKQARPLSGYMVYAHPFGSKETHLLGATDARGALTIEPEEGAVRVLLIKSGGFVMARLPILPGLDPVAVASVPDDQLRLQVEGLITGFQEELVDLIARRQVLMTRIRTRLKAGKKDEAKQLLGELRRLRTQQDCSRELLVERQRRSARDPRTQRQIDKLFDDTQTVINRFLDSRALDRLDREVNGGESAQATPAEEKES